jgi:hypothetical protein
MSKGGEAVETLRVGAKQEIFRSLGVHSRNRLWPPSLSLLSDHEVNGFVLPHTATMMCCLSTGPKATYQLWAGTSKTLRENNPFLLIILLSQSFVIVIGN